MCVDILDIDECDTDTDNCGINAACTNTDGGFDCTCNSGFTDSFGDGTQCDGNFNDIPICIINHSRQILAAVTTIPSTTLSTTPTTTTPTTTTTTTPTTTTATTTPTTTPITTPTTTTPTTTPSTAR